MSANKEWLEQNAELVAKVRQDTAPAFLRDAVTERFGDRYSIAFGDIPTWRYQYSVTLTSEHGERTCAVIDRSKANDPDAVAQLTERLGERLAANEDRPLAERRKNGYRPDLGRNS